MKNTIKNILLTISDIYNTEQGAPAFNAWMACMDGQNPKMVEMAFIDALKGAQFPPKPADILAIIKKQTGQTDRAQLAWGVAYQTISRMGAYSSPGFQDTVINSVIQQMGGWPYFCQMTNDERQWREKEFIEKYSLLADKDIEHPRYLNGVHKCRPELVACGYLPKPKTAGELSDGE